MKKLIILMAISGLLAVNSDIKCETKSINEMNLGELAQHYSDLNDKLVRVDNTVVIKGTQIKDPNPKAKGRMIIVPEQNGTNLNTSKPAKLVLETASDALDLAIKSKKSLVNRLFNSNKINTKIEAARQAVRTASDKVNQHATEVQSFKPYGK